MKIFGGFIIAYSSNMHHEISAITLNANSQKEATLVALNNWFEVYPLPNGYIRHNTIVTEITQAQLDCWLKNQ